MAKAVGEVGIGGDGLTVADEIDLHCASVPLRGWGVNLRCYYAPMKILYGVVGEGMGHAVRSKVVLEHLLCAGHEVEVMASGKAHGFLGERMSGVNKIHGLHMITEDNRVRRGKTLWSNVLSGIAGLPRNIAAYFRLIDDFAPQVVISDFESWTYFYAKSHGLPIFSIDNMQIINRCRHDPALVDDVGRSFEVTKAFVKSKLPFCDHYLISSFFHPPIRKRRTSMYPPILRPEILAAERTRGEHLLVYQTGAGYEALADALERTGLPCRIYGMRRDLKADEVEGRLRFRPFDEQTFVEDLASARAVVAAAGFTLMGEAVYLHKPMLAVPLANQFEQLLNGRYLQREGFGQCAEHPAALPVALGEFLQRVDDYQETISSYQQDGNRLLLSALDGLLAQALSGDFDKAG